MMFIGYLYGIRSERQLEKEIFYNMASRWFLGLNINDPVPHHSTISWNRRTRFKDTTIFQDIFDESVLQAINHDMVGGRVLFTNSTHLKANANKHKYTRKTIEQDTQNYIKDLNEAIQEDREEHEKKPLTVKKLSTWTGAFLFWSRNAVRYDNCFFACIKLGCAWFGILPELPVKDDIAAGRMKELNWQSGCPVFTQLAWHKDKWMSAPLKAFIDLTRKTFK